MSVFTILFTYYTKQSDMQHLKFNIISIANILTKEMTLKYYMLPAFVNYQKT
jgi:hypothetical protein